MPRFATCLAPLLALTLLGSPATSQEPDVHHQFDFWIGEWEVQNRFLVAEGDGAGTFRDGDRTRARITPVVGGNAILEEWAGPLHGGFMNGFSLRAWNPALQRWEILLNWTTTGDGGFGVMRGRFRHGRGEFLSSETAASRERYTFSDALPNTVRWDGARTKDYGRTWETYWIMEFSRTRAAAEVTLDNFFTNDWNAGKLSQRPAARKLDRLLGTWSGTQIGEDGSERDARLRSRLVNKNCLVVDVLEVKDDTGDTAGWDERLCVRSLVMPGGRWESWRTSENDPLLRKFNGASMDEETAVFEHTTSDGQLVREFLRFVEEGVIVIEEELVPADGGESRMLHTTELYRED